MNLNMLGTGPWQEQNTVTHHMGGHAVQLRITGDVYGHVATQSVTGDHVNPQESPLHTSAAQAVTEGEIEPLVVT